MADRTNAEAMTEIVKRLTDRIIFGRLRPRERLIEEDITAEFGVSRHVVRAAIATLEQSGLIVRRPNKGATVRDFSVREVDEIYEMRTLLQAEAARRLPMPADGVLIADLERLHREYGAAHDAGDLRAVATLNTLFHRTVWAACGNTCLSGLIDRLWIETLGIRCYGIGDPDLLRQARREHAGMIDALRAGDREGFAALSADHMQPALSAYKKAHGGWGGV